MNQLPNLFTNEQQQNHTPKVMVVLLELDMQSSRRLYCLRMGNS